MPKSEAMRRFSDWMSMPEIRPPQEVALTDAVSLALNEGGNFLGASVFLYESKGWTVFEDLSGHLGALPAEAWLEYAQKDDFIFAGYNDAIGYGELVVISHGAVIRHYLDDAQCPDEGINRGQLQAFDGEPIKSWVEVARFVDEDSVAFCERGWLWMHGAESETAGELKDAP